MFYLSQHAPHDAMIMVVQSSFNYFTVLGNPKWKVTHKMLFCFPQASIQNIPQFTSSFYQSSRNLSLWNLTLASTHPKPYFLLTLGPNSPWSSIYLKQESNLYFNPPYSSIRYQPQSILNPTWSNSSKERLGTINHIQV